jgi:hypothetical protein
MDIIVAVSTLVVIATALGIMAYRHDREIRESQDEINKKQD